MSEQEEHEQGGKFDRERTYTPAYVPIETLTTFVTSLDPQAIPRRIDRDMMRNISGGTQRKLMSGMTFLGLIKPGGETTDLLRELVKVHADEQQFKTVFGKIITVAYAKIVGDINVETDSAKTLEEAFRKNGADGTTLNESVRFFVKARQFAGLPVSKYIVSRKPRTQSNGGKPRQPRRNGDENKGTNPPPTPRNDPTPDSRTRDFPLFFKGKVEGFIRVPTDLAEEDCPIIELTTAIVKAYAFQRMAKDR